MQTFQWKCHPQAEALLLNALDECCKANTFIATLQNALLTETSTRLFDWLDHLVMGYSAQLEKELEEYGFVAETTTTSFRVFHHPGAQLPRVILQDHGQTICGAAVAVDSIANFLMVRGMSGHIEGSCLSPYRRCCVSTEHAVSLWVVERRGSHTVDPTYFDDHYLTKYLRAEELWKTRARSIEDEDVAMMHALGIAEKIVHLLGEGPAAWLVLQCEREYWQSRNTAGQIQKNRQDHLGMGWANHDHHTFRSSRRHFSQLVRLFEILGFRSRERFYAGKEAGWGAQVMEHTQCRLVLFLDVDLLPHELEIDFRFQTLPERDKLGTVGLWCALHGDSILHSGMHHLEAQFMFEDLKRDLDGKGIGMMDPFSSFPFLRQAFTKGELWMPDSHRVQKLLKAGLITPQQADKFLSQGAIGSHMENLQRREGFKGFNQRNVSDIIHKTDPRNVNF